MYFDFDQFIFSQRPAALQDAGLCVAEVSQMGVEIFWTFANAQTCAVVAMELSGKLGILPGGGTLPWLPS